MSKENISAQEQFDSTALISTAQLAAKLGCSTRTINRLVRDSKIPYVKLASNRHAFFVEDVNAFIELRYYKDQVIAIDRVMMKLFKPKKKS